MRFIAFLFLLTCSPPASCFWFLRCRHGNGHGDVGDSCSMFCRCRSPNTCEAIIQRCVPPGKVHEHCHMTRPCGKGLSCHPGIQRCYHVPRRLHEPCVAGFECEKGLSCHPGIQVCYHTVRRYNEPCVAGFTCGPGLSCQPGLQRCLHVPRRQGERCSLGFECAEGFGCTMCGSELFLTCQMNRVPIMDNEFYHRPYNKAAFLVTHNAFSNSIKYAVWIRNQRVSVSHQLRDGVRGLMLDIYPGWGDMDVQLCHGNCFWGGSSNLLHTLIEVRRFLEANRHEVITIIFEDYLRNPTILKRVFDQSGLSNHVLTYDLWGTKYKPWPTLREMRRLGRLVVFNNNGLGDFPYTPYNMWFTVRENRYGHPGIDSKVGDVNHKIPNAHWSKKISLIRQACADRGESRFVEDNFIERSLVLINSFETIPNALNPCLNHYKQLKDKLTTCHKAFGQLPNFLAVDFYQNGAQGGAFKAVHWLNKQWKEQIKKEKKSKTMSLFAAFGLMDDIFPHNQIRNISKIHETKLYKTEKRQKLSAFLKQYILPTVKMVNTPHSGNTQGFKANNNSSKKTTSHLATRHLATSNLSSRYLATSHLATSNLSSRYLATSNLSSRYLATSNLSSRYLATSHLETMTNKSTGNNHITEMIDPNTMVDIATSNYTTYPTNTNANVTMATHLHVTDSNSTNHMNISKGDLGTNVYKQWANHRTEDNNETKTDNGDEPIINNDNNPTAFYNVVEKPKHQIDVMTVGNNPLEQYIDQL